MGKSTPRAPTPPDPVATAQAQSQYNREAAIAQANLNRIDQYAPGGSIRYTQIGTNADGTPRYRQDTNLSPEQQALYNQQNQIAQQLGQTAQDQIGRVNDTMGSDFNYNGMTPLQTGVQNPQLQQFTGQMPGVQRSVSGPGVQYGFNPGGPIQNSYNNGGDITRNFQNNSGQIQTNVGPTDFSADGQRVANAVYNQATSRLDPQFQQQQGDLDARLAAQGIARGSEAQNREQGNYDRARNDAYNQANYSAIQAGANEQSRLFGLQLQQGQFHDQALGQQFGQNQAYAQFQNAAQGQANQQNANQAAFGNQAQQQQYAQNQGLASFYNSAQGQNNEQQMSAADLYNQSGAQSLQQQLSALGFNNQTSGQQFNQNLQNANMNNNARQEQIQEATYLRNLPLNDIAALLGTGGGVQNPQFNQFAQVGVAAPDYMGQVNNTFNAQQNQYNQAQANRSQMLGSIFGLAGTAATMFSDRRLKRDVVRIGTLANGLATYAFNYIGDKVRRFGVMAQDALELVPEAVTVHPSGYLAVDYGKVW
jgi:hypothetical protein